MMGIVSVISIRQLQQFVAVAEELHFARAAQHLGMAQSPLSQAIRALEEEVGVPLLARDRRGVALTGAGEVFLAEARGLLLGSAQAVRRARWAHEGGTERIAIGFVGSIAYTLLPAIVRGFHTVHPGVRLAMSEGTSVDHVTAVRTGRLDLGIIRPAGAEVADLATKILARDPLVVALPRNHALAQSALVSLAALAGDRFVLFTPAGPAPLHSLLLAACRESGFEPLFDYEVQHLPSAIGVVASGAAVALLPASLSAVRHSGVVFRGLSGIGSDLRFEALAVWRATNPSRILPALVATLPSVATK